jgi:transposase
VSGITTKLHLVTTAQGHVIDGFLTGGNVHDVSVAGEAVSDIYGCYVLADKGYDSDEFRDFLRSQNNEPVIPGRSNRITKIVYDEERYKDRRKIEILFGHLKENKRIDTRFDKRDDVFLAFVALALIKISLHLIIS